MLSPFDLSQLLIAAWRCQLDRDAGDVVWGLRELGLEIVASGQSYFVRPVSSLGAQIARFLLGLASHAYGSRARNTHSLRHDFILTPIGPLPVGPTRRHRRRDRVRVQSPPRCRALISVLTLWLLSHRPILNLIIRSDNLARPFSAHSQITKTRQPASMSAAWAA